MEETLGWGVSMSNTAHEERPDQVVTIRVTSTEKAALKSLAEMGNLTMSEVIRTALKTERHDTEKMLTKARRVQKPNPEMLMQLARVGGLMKALHIALLTAKHNGARIDIQSLFSNQKEILEQLKAVRQIVDQDRPC